MGYTRIFKLGSASARRPAVIQADAPPEIDDEPVADHRKVPKHTSCKDYIVYHLRLSRLLSRMHSLLVDVSVSRVGKKITAAVPIDVKKNLHSKFGLDGQCGLLLVTREEAVLRHDLGGQTK